MGTAQLSAARASSQRSNSSTTGASWRSRGPAPPQTSPLNAVVRPAPRSDPVKAIFCWTGVNGHGKVVARLVAKRLLDGFHSAVHRVEWRRR